MSTIITGDLNEGAFYLNMEVDLSAAAAITATRGSGVSATKTNTGQYTFVIKTGARAIPMVEILARSCDLSGTPATAFWAKVVSVVQSVSTGDMTVVVNTLTNAATPVAGDTAGACQLSVMLCMRTIKDPNIAQL